MEEAGGHPPGLRRTGQRKVDYSLESQRRVKMFIEKGRPVGFRRIASAFSDGGHFKRSGTFKLTKFSEIGSKVSVKIREQDHRKIGRAHV